MYCIVVTGGEAEVKFARKRGDFFVWPDADDISWLDMYNLTSIKTPMLDPKGIRMYPTPEENAKYFY